MAKTMKDGHRTQTIDRPWETSAEALTITTGDSTAASTLSPKTPLRSMSHGNFRSSSSVVGPVVVSVGSAAPAAKRATSVVEEMETKQRENMSRKLKGLQLIGGGRSPQPKVEMPTIVDSRFARKAALTRSPLRRDSVANYQAVTPAALSLKGGSSTATPSVSPREPELFPLRASHSLTSLNRIYDRGFSVFASDDFDGYSTEKGLKKNGTGTGNGLLGLSLTSAVCRELLADASPTREIKRAEEKAAEDDIDKISKDTKHTSFSGILQSASDNQKSKHDGCLTSSVNSPTEGPPLLNLKTYPKPQVPTKPADLKASTSNGERTRTSPRVGSAEQNHSEAASSSSVPGATAHYNQIPGDLDHKRGCSNDIAKDLSRTVETTQKGNYDSADIFRRSSPHLNDDETRSVPPKSSFRAGLQVDVSKRDAVIPSKTYSEALDFTTKASTRLGTVPGSSFGLQSNATSGFVNHQKMDSRLSDCNTVDSGIGRSEAAGSPGSHYLDSADELDNKAGWTASTTDSFNDGRDNHQQQQLKRQTKKEFVSTAVISLSPTVMETSKVNYIGIKPTIEDTNVSTRRSYHEQNSLPASSLRSTPQQEKTHHFQGAQRLSSVPSRSSHSSSYSTTPSQPTPEFITLDSKVPVEADIGRTIRISGHKHHREEGVPGVVPSNLKRSSEEHRKIGTRNYEAELSESPKTSGSRYTRSLWESEVTEVKRRADDRSSREVHENRTRVGDEPQRSRIKSAVFEEKEGRKETRTIETTQPYTALNKKNQDRFHQDQHRTGTRHDVREGTELFRNENTILQDPMRVTADTRRDTRRTPDSKDELLYVSRDPQSVERTHLRQTHENSAGLQSRQNHELIGSKKEEPIIATRADDGMIDIEVQLIKGLTGLGFCIEGGIDSPIGDRPITVKRLFKGESAAKGKLQPGDIILAINGKPMSNKSHYQAWNQLKSYPEGPINLFVRRPRPLPPGTLV